MFQPFTVTNDKNKDYPALIQALKALSVGETNTVALLSNAGALLNWYLEDVNWVGFYLFDQNENQLVLGPFQGLPACLRIPPGKGVCGTAYSTGETQLIDDVLQFPGHIACDSASRSELVVPMVKDGQCIGVLDIDSPSLSRFDELDAKWMKEAVSVILSCLV